jgi:hypothetical protein
MTQTVGITSERQNRSLLTVRREKSKCFFLPIKENPKKADALGDDPLKPYSSFALHFTKKIGTTLKMGSRDF